MTKEEAQYKRAVTRARKLLEQYAEGDEGLRASIVRAVDKAENLSRWVEAPEREAAYALRREISRAEAAGRAARQASRETEMRALREKELETRPAPGSFEHELATGRRARVYQANPNWSVDHRLR